MSVCIPAYNAAETVVAAVESALNQDHDDLEVVVVDDASIDGTADLLRDHFGGHVRLFVNRKTIGQAQNSNAAVAQSRGAFVKFLHADDSLDPRCVGRMITALREHPSAGMVFSRRRVELHHGRAEEVAWRDRHAHPERDFHSLGRINSKGELFEQLLAHGLRKNCIGEPVCVMVRRECLERLGGFHRYVRQVLDLDLWLRMTANYDVAFLDEELAVYRYSSVGSETAMNLRTRSFWLDRLWMLEGLASFPDLVRRYPRILEMLEAERRLAWRSVLRDAVYARASAPSARIWWTYARKRALDFRGGLFGTIPPASPQANDS